VEKSHGITIARRLATDGRVVRVYDPLALANARATLGDTVAYVHSIAECLGGADAAVITTPGEEFAGLRADTFQQLLAPGALVFDCWRLFRAHEFNGIRYAAVGMA
jgi:UDPglucose 6-dehydrogenase